VAIPSLDGAVSVWDIASGVEQPLRRGTPARQISTDEDQKVSVMDGVGARIHAAAFGTDGRTLYTVDNETWRYWHLETGVQLNESYWRLDHAPPRSVSFSPDGRSFVAVLEDRSAGLWDDDGNKLASFKGHEDPISAVAFNPAGKRIATAGHDGSVRLWESSADLGLPLLLDGHLAAITAASFSRDGSTVLTASADKTACLSDATTAQLRHELSPRIAVAVPGVADKVLGAVRIAEFSPDGSKVVTVSDDIKARILGERGTAAQVPFTPTRVFDARSGKELFALDGLRGTIDSVSFSADSKWLLASPRVRFRAVDYDASGHERGGMSGGLVPATWAYLWDLTTGKSASLPWGDRKPTTYAVFSADGKRVLTGDPWGRICDAASGAELVRLENFAYGNTAMFSPDGRQALVFRDLRLDRMPGETFSSDKERTPSLVGIWDATTGKKIGDLGHPDHVHAVAYSRDSTAIVTACRDGTARLWDAATGAQQALLHGHLRALNSAAFSPDGRFIVTASDDRTARIWHTATGTEFFTLSGHQGPVHVAVFSPDGQRVLTASADGSARLWPADPLPLARERQPRELTAAELAPFELGTGSR
jgi:WD40 repeat protein